MFLVLIYHMLIPIIRISTTEALKSSGITAKNINKNLLSTKCPQINIFGLLICLSHLELNKTSTPLWPSFTEEVNSIWKCISTVQYPGRWKTNFTFKIVFTDTGTEKKMCSVSLTNTFILEQSLHSASNKSFDVAKVMHQFQEEMPFLHLFK